jgi:hypothetical protein
MNPAIVLPKQRKQVEVATTVKRAIWLYFWLLIFEGALRKWVFPGLASPLLLVREPVAVYILWSAWSRNRFPRNPYIAITVAISVLGGITAVLLGHGNLTVALFGARISLLHFPLLFIIGSYFSRDDVLQVGRVLLWLTLPMAILIAFQFYSPQSAWVNRGIGGDGAGGGFAGAMGYFRPPATFSFISGTVQFFGLAAAYISYFWINPKTVNRLLLISATIGLLAAIPLSISRSLFYQILLSTAFIGVAVSRNPKFLGRFLVSGIALVMVFALLNQTNLFQTSTEAFTERFTNATEQEGGIKGTLVDRFLGGMLGAINDSGDLPFFGAGMGIGTNAGAQMLTGSRMSFLISEGEWGRLIGEMGLLMGLILILVRVALVVNLSISSYRSLRRGDMLPWMLLSFGLLMILQGQWAQPTSLGFATIAGGLLLASLSELRLTQHTSTSRHSHKIRV